MSKTKQFASFLPEDMVQGGLIDDQDVTIKSATFAMFDYGGKSESGASLALRLELEDTDGGIHEQFASLGKVATENFAPSEDGFNIVQTGEKSALNKGSNYEHFMTSLLAAGFPSTLLKNGINGMDGTKVHVVRKKIERKGGNFMFQKEGGSEVLVVTEVLSLPGEGGGKKAAGGAKAAPAKAAPAKASAAKAAPADDAGDGEVSDFDNELRMVLVGAVADAPAGLTKPKLVQVVFKGYDGDKNKAAKRVAEESFLAAGAEAGLWAWDGKTLSAAE